MVVVGCVGGAEGGERNIYIMQNRVCKLRVVEGVTG